MKAVWKGYLKFSLVAIPIKMYHAVAKKGIQFHLLHGECGHRIRQDKVCPLCHKSLGEEEIIRGYQYGKDLFVPVTDADLKSAEKEASPVIKIAKFVEESRISPIYFMDAHYLLPEGPVGAEGFAVLHRALGETGKAALAKVVWRNKEVLLAIRPYEGALVAYTLHYPEEIQGLQEIKDAEGVEQVPVDLQSLALAKTLIANLSGDFIPEEYYDEYTGTLLKFIQAKAEGKELRVEPRVEMAKVVSLMDALQRSVAETKKTPGLPKKAMAAAGAGTVKAPGRKKKAHA
jgi:DNA end-binding protein Ku